MSIAIRKDSTTNVLEDIAFGPSDEDVLKDVQTHAEFTALPVPTVVCKGSGSDPTITSITVDADGLITDVDWNDEGDSYVAGDVLVFTQGSVSGRFTLRSSDLLTTTTTSLRNLSGVEIIGYTPGAGKTAAIFPAATWDALTQKPVANGGWTVSGSFVVAQVAMSELDQLKDKAREAIGWLGRLHNDYVHYGQFYPNIVAVIGAAPLDWVHPALQIVLQRNAPSVGDITVARRIATLDKLMEGMSDAAGAMEFFPAARVAAGLRLAQGLQPRMVAYPVFWVDPRTDPPTRIAVRNVIDFSQATGYGSVTGLDLKASQIDNTADFALADWIDSIPGDVPAKMFDLTMTVAEIPAGDTTVDGTLSWTLPGDSGSALTEIQIDHAEGTQDYGPLPPTTLAATVTSRAATGLTAGAHWFKARAKNANGYGPWMEIKTTVTQATAE